MRLSEAILLGDTLKRMGSGWLFRDHRGECSGCALGGAMLAVGREDEFFAERKRTGNYLLTSLECFKQAWPWVTAEHSYNISRLYAEVKAGEKTIEDVADYVRTIEPAEPKFPEVWEEGYPQSVKEAVEEADFLALRIPENGVHE